MRGEREVNDLARAGENVGLRIADDMLTFLRNGQSALDTDGVRMRLAMNSRVRIGVTRSPRVSVRNRSPTEFRHECWAASALPLAACRSARPYHGRFLAKSRVAGRRPAFRQVQPDAPKTRGLAPH
jgi:hypothetical protein